MNIFIPVWIIWIIFVTRCICTGVGYIKNTSLEVSLDICMIGKNIILIG